MPKIITEEKRVIARSNIRKKTEELINEIGFKNITITKICEAVPIGKGTFYYYYGSKELLLYEIIKEKEEYLMKQMLVYSKSSLKVEEKVIRALREVYIGRNSIVNMVSAWELEKILVKLPVEVVNDKELSGKSFFELAMLKLGINPKYVDMGVLGELLDAINFVASRDSKHGNLAKSKSLDILIGGVASYIASKQNSHGDDGEEG